MISQLSSYYITYYHINSYCKAYYITLCDFHLIDENTEDRIISKSPRITARSVEHGF